MRKAKGECKQYPGACHLAMPPGALLVTLAASDLLLPLQNWGMHITETHDMPGMSALAELRNQRVLCIALQAFSARIFLLQTCHTWDILMSQQELSKKLQRAQKLRVYCLVQVFFRNCWQCSFWIRICCTKRSNLSDKCKKTVHITIQVKVLLQVEWVYSQDLLLPSSSLFELFVLYQASKKNLMLTGWVLHCYLDKGQSVPLCLSPLFRM